MADAIKFIHASDLHLDQPFEGISSIPAHIKTTLANAPYEAAEKLFETAIVENVDFVLLAGDVACLERGGPRVAAFLLNQFERLADKGITVYWCSGSVDQPDRWPTSIELPDNVVTFTSAVVDRIAHNRNGRQIATILGCGHDGKKRVLGEFRVDETDPFPIAFCHGKLDTNNFSMHQIRYWALGGNHQRSVIEKQDSIGIYPGTTQCRNIRETGSHSCTLCRVDTQGQLKIHTIDIDRVRWLNQTVAVAENVRIEELQNVLADRALKIASESPDQLVLVNWLTTTTGDFNPQIRLDSFREEVLQWLRDEFGKDGEQGIWSVDFRVKEPKNLPGSWYEEDTILGDYLRSVARFNGDETIPLGLHDYIPASVQDDSLVGIARVGKDQREIILRDAAMIGVEYLNQHEYETTDNS